MSYFDTKKGITLENDDLKWKSVFKNKNDFFEWVVGSKPIEQPKFKSKGIL